MDETGRIVAGRYECLEKIGRGASARVYRALDRNTHQLLALKILAGGNSGNESQQKQFRRELEALKKLKSPYTVRLVDAGADEEDLYLAMEYVSGQSLQEILQSQAPLDPSRACRLVVQLLQALEEAHHKGIVHRDLKPANILLQIEGSGEHVRLGDFGIARMIGMTTYNSAGTGTPHYMSPEQIEGHDVGCESDLYAVGVVLYEMLVGRPPFEGDMNTIMAAHLRRAPAWPTQPKVPKRLRQIIEQAMKKKPSARYRSAQAMRDAIEGWLHGSSLPMQYREDRRSWWIAGMIFFSALALFANIDGTLNFFSNANKWWQTKKKAAPGTRKAKARPRSQAITPPPPPTIAQAKADKPAKGAAARRAAARKPGPGATPPGSRAVPSPGEARSVAKVPSAARLWIPSGEYRRGSPLDERGREKDEHQHQVQITKGFWLWRTEITRAQYRQLVPLPPGQKGCPTCPVTAVSWHQAARWANLLSQRQGQERCFRCTRQGKGYHCTARARFAGAGNITQCKGWRLPTDAEWEYAYRAGTQSALYNGALAKGDAQPRLREIGWYKANSDDGVHPVARKKPNPWGLYDMAGNVWEWVYDRKTPHPKTRFILIDPTGADKGYARTQRGGSYFDDAPWLRAAARLHEDASKTNRFTGFRLARTGR